MKFGLQDFVNWQKVCQGCTKQGDFGKCTVYTHVPSMYARGGVCPFNPPIVLTKKQKVRAGQQKTKRMKG